MTPSIHKVALVSLLFVLISACATNITGRKQISLVSESEAIEASKQAYVNTLKPYKDKGKLDSRQDVVARVNRITDKLIVQAIKKRPASGKWDWSVKVIDDPSLVNAWCMAGGKMAIYTGLITKLQATDDEIAQVMGHEISHALANHSAERMSMAMASELAIGAYSKVTGTVATKDSLPAMAAQVALTLPNSRTSESEADALGIELAAKAGYNPNAAVTLWQKMAKVSGSGGLEFLSTHPSPKNREKALRNLIPKMMPYYNAAR